jgi:glycosyltransferase involved in cell wall biosynthesis
VKVAQVSTRFPPGPGGVERHVAEIGRRLGSRGHVVSVYTSDLLTEFPWERLDAAVPREETLPWGRVHRRPVFSLPGPFHYPFFRGLGSALRREAPDVVHVHTYGTHQVAVARRFGRRAGTPFVLTAHFHPIWSIYGGWTRHRLRAFYDRRVGGPLVQSAARLIVQTREEQRLIASLGFALPPTEIVPPGYTPLPPPPADDGFRRRFAVEGPYLLFVGRLASNKGLLPLVDAFSALGPAHRDVSLVIVGIDGGMQSSVEARVREKGLGGRVRLLGHVDEEALLADAYRGARATVLPSEYEAFGLVLLESMAQGTPVIASRVGGIPEVVEDGKGGVLVTPGDVPRLTEAMDRLLGDDSWRDRLGEYGRAEIVPRYTWERLVDRLEAVYASVTSR